MNLKSDDECDDDELIDKLEAQNKARKEQPVDLDKMTRRQRMAYEAAQNSSGLPAGQQVSITDVGALNQLTGDDNVLYSLGSRRAKLVGEDG